LPFDQQAGGVMMATKTSRSSWDVRIRQEWCKGCEVCVEVCKPGVLEMDGLVAVVAHSEACTGCLMCEMLCPDFAIEVVAQEGAPEGVCEE
jgi:NAD-dependent dihydropyrimidine dehydrogenase PreA subunit